MRHLRSSYQFLLKYKYVENWNRECNENYFSFPYAYFMTKAVSTGKFNVLYMATYTLDYTYDQVKADFGIKMEHPTHFKCILKKIKY
jgi:hypothetical protein